MARDRRFSMYDDAPRARLSLGSIGEAIGLFKYLLPYRRKFIAAQVLLLIASLAGLAFPYFTGMLIDGATRGLPGLNGSESPSVPIPNINSVALLLMSVLLLRAVCTSIQTYWLTEVSERSLADLRRDTYSRLIHLPMAFFSQRRVGELTSRLAADIALIQQTLTGSIPQFVGQLIMLSGGLVLIAFTSGRLTLVMLSSVPVVMVLAIILGKLTRRISREAQDKLAETNVVVEETLQGIANVKGFTNENYETNRYRNGIDSFIGVVLRGAVYQGAFGAFITFMGFGSIVLVIWYGARLVETGEMSFGELTRFLLYTMYIAGAIGGFVRLYTDLQRTVGATQRIRELLQEPTEEDPTPDPVTPIPISGDIAFEGVNFAYPSRKEIPVLKSLSLSAKAGQRIALVGPSGSGKSTIVSLLLRFYHPDSGKILIDGKDAQSYPLKALRSHMAVVAQDVMLFGGTIGENIAYGRPGASPEEIEEAAQKANAHDFIMGFPEKYQTIVGERGIQLSGGQRQRVAIARAILRNPAILILDEATSSLDSESEYLVQQALDSLMQGRTSVIIAHRLSTVRRADCIYVVKEGQIVESGTHAELVNRPDGVYRTLSELQFDSEMNPHSSIPN